MYETLERKLNSESSSYSEPQWRSWVTNARIAIGFLRCFPHLIIWRLHPNRTVINYDLKVWKERRNLTYSSISTFIYLMMHYPEYRNLFYYRIGFAKVFVAFLCPQVSTLYLSAERIGPGLFIYHGFGCRLGAKSIGKDCTLFHHVTLGWTKSGQPTIGNQVTMSAGASVLGGITIGDKVTIGANTVVVKDVADGCTVVGGPTYVVRRNGKRVREKL